MSAPKGKWTWKGLELLGSHWHPIIKTSLRDAIPAPHSVLPRSSRVILMNSHRPPNASVCCIRTACSETLLRTLTCHHLLSAGLLLVMSINSSPARREEKKVVTTKSLTSNLLSPRLPLGNCSLHTREQPNGTWASPTQAL